MNYQSEQSEDPISKKLEALKYDWSLIAEDRSKKLAEVNKDYQKFEQPLIIKIVYGTALANVLAIFNFAGDPFIIFYMSSLVLVLASYMMRYYAGKYRFEDEKLLVDIRHFHNEIQFSENALNFYTYWLGNNIEKQLVVQRLINKTEEDQRNLQYLKKHHNYITQQGSNEEKRGKKLPKLIQSMADIKELNQDQLKKSEAWYIPLLFFSWLLSFSALLVKIYGYDRYLPDFRYFPIWVGLTLFVTTLLVIIGLWAHFQWKLTKIRHKTVILDCHVKDYNKITEIEEAQNPPELDMFTSRG